MEILTPRERFSLLVFDEKPDRIPIFPLITNHSAYVSNYPIKEYYTKGKILAHCQINAYEIYQTDFLSVFSDVGLIAEALGSEFEYPEDDLPKLKKPLFNCLKDFMKKGLKIEYKEDKGRFPLYFSAIEILYNSLGDFLPVLAYIPAPFTTLALLFEPKEILKDLTKKENKKIIKEVLSLITDFTIQFIKGIINYCALPIIVDPLASGSVVSPKIYKNFAFPYEEKLINYLHRYDLDVILHICGNTQVYLKELKKSSADLLSLDKIDLFYAKKILGNKFRLIGNFDTTEILLADIKEIRQKVKKLVLKMKENKKGYILATGCEVPFSTKKENLKAFIEEGKKWGKYRF
uniref:Uroporphyrinogen decarboxylase (URO-D) domain-containing protein n=1 Tax=candidate division WOR-3 bacterium TaxID=2052148 RepID=A0A7V6CMN9_UNCW3